MNDLPAARRDPRQLTRLLIRQQEEEPGDLKATQHRITQHVKAFFGADFCIIFAMDPMTRAFLEPISDSEENVSREPSLSPPRPDGLTKTVLERGPIVVEDLEQQPEYASEFSRSKGIRSFAALALRTMRRQRPLAVLYLDSLTAGHFGPKDQHLLEDVAELASRHLQNTWFLARNQEVAKAGQAINRERFDNAHLLFDTLVPHLAKIVDCSHLCLLALPHRRAERFNVYVHYANQPESTCEMLDKSVEGAWSWLLERNRSLLVRELSQEQGREGFPGGLDALPWVNWELKPESLLFVPLLFENKPLGLLAVAHPSPWTYEEEDRQTLELLANHIALTVNNHRLFADLGRLNDAGKILTQNLESETVLQLVVDVILKTTDADLVLLYPYLKASESFDLPPRQSGEFKSPTSHLHSQFVRPDDIAALVVRKRQPTFARESTKLYSDLGGNPERRQGNFEIREKIRSVAAVPLLVGDEPVGVLFINFRAPQSFDEPQQQLFGSLASYAAIAIKNAREFGTLSRRHIEELETLQTIDREISRFDNLHDLLTKILQGAKARIPAADIASILLYDSQRQELRVEDSIGLQESRKGERLPLKGRGLVIRAFKDQRILLANDVQAPDWSEDFIDTGAGTRAEIDVPLLDGDQVLGILNLESREPGILKEPDVRFLTTLAGQAVLAVRQAQALETQTRLAKAGQLLIDLGKEFTQQLDVKRVLGLIVDRAIEHTGAHAGSLMLFDKDRNLLNVVEERGGSLGRPLHLEEGIIGLVARQRTTLNVFDVTEPPWDKVYLDAIPGTNSELAVPLLAEGELKGVLNIESPTVHHFDDRHEWLIEALAAFAVIALQNAERFEKAEKRGRKLKALYDEANQVIRQLENPEFLMQAVVEHALKLTGASQVDLDLYEGGRLAVTYQVREGDQPFKRFDLSGPEAEMPPLGITKYVVQTRSSYRTHGNAAEDPLYRGEEDVRSELAVPLLKGSGELIGVLNVESRIPDLFDDDAQEALELYAAQAVVAIENTRNFARAERERQRFALLLEARRELEKITQLEQVDWAYTIVSRIAGSQYKSQVVIRRFEPDTGDLVRKVAALESPEPFSTIKLGDQLNGWVARNRQPIVVPDFNELPPERRFDRSNLKDRAFLVVPILFDQNYYGNLALSHEKPYYFQHADLELLSGLAQQLAFTLYRLEEATAHREAEQRAKEDEVMSRVGHQAYEIAHRMGNEFGPVKSYVRRIREAFHEAGITGPKLEGYLDEIEGSAEWLLSVSARLQEESTRSAEPSLIPVRELIEEALGALHLAGREGNPIELEREISPMAGKVFVDREPIKAALVNLLNNAIEAMPDGGRLTMGTENAGRRVRIWVRDTGCGIAPENLKNVFTLFYSTKGKNRGFGLWSVQGNVKAQGGTIEVKSTQDLGTTFTIDLPRAAEDNNA